MATPPERSSVHSLAWQAALLLLTLAVLAWRAWPDRTLQVIFLETSGDAALIVTPAGGYVLIDGGSDPAALAAALGRAMPFWRRSLDAVVLTSADMAHLPGQVAALARYRTGLVLAPPTLGHSALVAEWRRLLQANQTPVHVARAGQRLEFAGVALYVLAAEPAEGAGLVLRLEYGATSVVFDHSGGDAGERVLAGVAQRPANLLAFPWQRDAHIPFVAALHPQSIVLTDGFAADRPAEQTFTARAIGGARLYHEQLNGAITWRSDGRHAWVTTERFSDTYQH